MPLVFSEEALGKSFNGRIIEHCVSRVEKKCLALVARIVNPCSFPSKVGTVCSYPENFRLIMPTKFIGSNFQPSAYGTNSAKCDVNPQFNLMKENILLPLISINSDHIKLVALSSNCDHIKACTSPSTVIFRYFILTAFHFSLILLNTNRLFRTW